MIARILATTTLVVCLGLPLRAQLANTTALVGNVADQEGAAMSGVTVTAVNEGTHDTYTAVTNAEGYYNIQFIRIGTYTVTAAESGFQTMRQTGILVQTNQAVRANFTLRVGQVQQQITVSGGVPPLATDDASLSEIISQTSTTELPLNGRDPLQLAVTTPGVIPGMKTSSGNPGGGEDFIGAGTREIQNSISLDGVSIMNNLITTTTFRPSVDAVQEFQVQTGTYPAQYGGYMGVQMNVVTKSGVNDFHGAAWEFLRNDRLDARGFFEDPSSPKSPFRQNQFGGEFAGPLLIPKLYNGRDKTFFMMDYEGLRQSQSLAALDTVLTPQMRQGDFSQISTPLTDPLNGGVPFAGNQIPQSRLSPQALSALQYMPQPNLPGISNNYLANVRSANTTDQVIGRVDENIGQWTRLFFRYAWENTTLLNGNTNPFNGYNQPVHDDNFVIGYTRTFSASIVNDARFGRQHTTIDSVNFFNSADQAGAGSSIGIPGFTTDASNPGLPNLTVAGYMPIGGQNMASTNWYQTDSTWQGTDVLSINKGAHSLAAGVEIRKLITLRTANNNPRGLFSFTGQLSGNAATDLMLGLPQQVTTPGPLVPGGVAEYRDGFFVQDKWQVTPKLTLTMGLRYELNTVPESTNGNATRLNRDLTGFVPTQVPQQIGLIDPNHHDFAPRFGFAWRAPGSFIVRGGYGIYYNPNQLNTYTLLTTNPPFSTIYTYDANLASGLLLSLSNPTPSGAQAGTAKPNAVSPNWHLPDAYMNQWSVDVEHALWHNAGLDVQYLGSHSLHLDRSYYNNTPLPGPGPVADRRPNSAFSTIRIIQNDEIANYQALNVVLRQRTSHGLTFLLSYTWSHALDVSTDSNGGGAPMDPYNWRGDYGNSNWDLRHRFVASYIYDLPFFQHSGHRFLHAILANWQVNGITTIQTGFPFNVTIPGDQANTGVGNQRPDLVSAPSANCGSGHLSGCISSGAFVLPALYAYGNAGRNLLYGPAHATTDFSLFKNIPLHERAKLQIRSEFFNIFNTPYFANPNAVLGTSAFGTISSTLNNNRQIQFALKLTF
jgi:hypothetical protein